MPGRENSKSQGVVMTSASGRGGADFGGEIETLGLRNYTCILSQKPRPAQR